MITHQEFPYLQELVINDAYAVKNLRVPVFEPGQEFKHLVLTGRNGSGKTTVLKDLFDATQHDIKSPGRAVGANRQGYGSLPRGSFRLDKDKVEPVFVSPASELFGRLEFRYETILTYFEAYRKTQVQEVTTITKEDIPTSQLLLSQPSQAIDYIKQYLVNKKVFSLFDAVEGNAEAAQQKEQFFANLENLFRQFYDDSGLKLEFVREAFEFYIVHSDSRRTTFNQLPAGFSALFSILIDLLIRVDLLRKQASDYTYDPCGFVLIDEPETHLHLEMQYQILPLLTSLFPNLQFIVATHSPAVASSIKNATVFDLSTGQVLGDQAAGSSFSELMQTHFGLENEYSNVADKILEEVAKIGQMADRAAALARLRQLLEEQGRYMSPVLRLDVQAHLLHLQREQAA